MTTRLAEIKLLFNNGALAVGALAIGRAKSRSLDK
jgi:hypothetical protein